MSDVAAVAAISGGLSFLSATVGALTTYMVSQRNTNATIATAQNQHAVEMARIEAENQRLRDANREDERRNRQSTYHRHLTVVVAIYNQMGRQISVAEASEVQGEYGHLQSGVLLFAPPSVRTAAYAVSAVYNKVWDEMQEHRQAHPQKSESEHWDDVTTVHRQEFGIQVAALIDAMHADITRGVLVDTEDG
jgi:hypothetical protein